MGVFAARFEDGEDITRLSVLERVLETAGGDARGFRDRYEDPAADVAARVRIASDWEAARGEFAIFGVPTLRIEGVPRPLYLRLEQRLTPVDGRAFWDRFSALTEAAPFLLEIKAAERQEPEPI
jgi:predicted DsbA family dithiol-disulfide isomerase